MKVQFSPLAFLLISTVAFTFGCAKPLPANLSGVQSQNSSGSNTPRRPDSIVNNQPNPPSQSFQPSQSQSVVLSIETNTSAKTDCSAADAAFTGSVLNADPDLKACAEFVLDVPKTSSRYGEFRYCTNDADFTSLSGNPDWYYTSSDRSWRLTGDGTVRTRNSYFVPGVYRMVVMDSKGAKYYSSFAEVKRPGSADCMENPAPRPVTCSWLGFVYGPLIPPSQPCSAANQGQQVNKDNVTYTCTCQ